MYYETIDGKWHEFIQGQPPRPLSDAEAAMIVWGTDDSAHMDGPPALDSRANIATE